MTKQERLDRDYIKAMGLDFDTMADEFKRALCVKYTEEYKSTLRNKLKDQLESPNVRFIEDSHRRNESNRYKVYFVMYNLYVNNKLKPCTIPNMKNWYPHISEPTLYKMKSEIVKVTKQAA